MKRFVVFCGVLGGIALYLFTDFSSIHEAGATGGAFPYTKHGGGTVDGFTFSGVDRAVNPDFFLYYYDDPQAGAYVAGECAHCHEPHASFGGLEPPPEFGGDAGPDKYFLMKEYGASANYATLCWYCHENINYNPSLGGGAGYWGFYHGKAVYEDSSHYKSSVFSWPGTTGDPVTIFPRSSRSSLPSGNQGSCLNCHSPHGIREGGTSTAFDTTAVPTSPTNYHLAANNESVSADYLIPRQLIAWEEALCENCHDGTPAINIKGEIDKRGAYTGSGTTDGGGGSGHLVDYTALAGRHTAAEGNEVTQKASPGDLRHVECYDCHNPHVATGHGSGDTIGTAAFNRVKGMKYVDIDGVDRDPAQGARQPYIYEICFRCHGDTWNQVFGGASKIFPTETTSRPPGLSNKRKEFNPNTSSAGTGYGPNQAFNSAYHPVAAAGRNTTETLCNQLKSGGFPSLDCATAAMAKISLQNLTINCTDCHNNNAAGGTAGTAMGPVTESNLRSTDKSSVYAGASPLGPHGSTITTPALNFNTGVSDSGDRSILRDYYFTRITGITSRPFADPGGAGDRDDFQERFKLCFNCHDYAAFYDGTNTNFPWHPLHLVADGGGLWAACGSACHYCHYNVHSNVECPTTLLGDGGGGELPSDGDTHLICFAPGVVTADMAAKPQWKTVNGGADHYCNLRCHGVTMDYQYPCGISCTDY